MLCVVEDEFGEVVAVSPTVKVDMPTTQHSKKMRLPSQSFRPGIVTGQMLS